MTAVAYLWMNRLGRLPQTPRVFTQQSSAKHMTQQRVMR
jgi:hypothetical protein